MSARRVFQSLLFPVILAGACAAYVRFYPRFAEDQLMILSGLICVVVMPMMVGLEYLLPFERDWFRGHGDLWSDALHTHLVLPWVARVCQSGLGWVLIYLGTLAFPGRKGVWPSDWPLVAQFALAVCASELVFYWAHRLFHAHSALWRLHAVHHGATRVYWMNSGRFHPIETFLTMVVFIAPMILMGAGPAVMGLFWTYNSIHGYLEHCNIDYRNGWLNWVFNSAQLHRWHHSKDYAESNKNYGKTLILFDVIFGTRYLPGGARVKGVGIGDEDVPPTYLAQLIYPFRSKEGVRAQA